MNRDEAKQLFYDADGSELDDVLIDKIYDSFENRSCENCKTKNCSVKKILVEKDEISTDYFNCNDWESK